MSPEKLVLLWFLSLIAVGAALLSLPLMTTAGGISLIDAVFTAATAVCVTGLMVLNLEHDFTFWGQLTVLVLIQLGGIGIVTFASFVIFSGAGRLPIAYQDMLSSTVPAPARISLRQTTAAVVRFTLLIEAAGAALLFAAWPEEGGLWVRLWQSVFHAISAFCNAGISLFASNLERFAASPAVPAVVMTLIILGGFGFTNFHELAVRLRRGSLRWSQFSLFLKVSIVATLALNLFGAATLLALEHGVAFADLAWPDKGMAALFHAVTARTAGFDTVAMGEFTELSLHLLIVLMFIGAVSGSTAGGIKVSTLAVLLGMIRAYVRNFRDLILFHRRIPAMDQRKAVVLFFASLFVINLGLFALYALEAPLVRHGESPGVFLNLVFEVASALGTVGLSTGVTAGLSTAGKAVIIALMVVGRLGPLLIIAAWAARPQPTPFTNPQETLPVG